MCGPMFFLRASPLNDEIFIYLFCEKYNLKKKKLRVVTIFKKDMSAKTKYRSWGLTY